MLAGRDVLGQAATGTGKTAAFGLPLVQQIALEGWHRRTPRAFILVPTRELAMQVAAALTSFATASRLSIVAVYGGQPIVTQLRALKQGAHILVATPGRALDMINRGALVLDDVRHVVLDEADEMLDMGFAEDLDAIFARMPTERQTALFSATLPPRIADMSARHLSDPVRIKIAAATAVKGVAPLVQQLVYFVDIKHRAMALTRLVEMDAPTSAIVFCRTRQDVDSLYQTLMARSMSCDSLHGGLSQEQRDRVMRRFRDGSTNLLIATDVAARGLDIDHVSHVFNYDVPGNAEVYVHRIGRTGRAGRAGVAITFAQPRSRRLLHAIEHLGKMRLTIATLPTLADVQKRRLEQTKQALLTVLSQPQNARFRPMIEAMAAEHNPVELACAALNLLNQARGSHAGDEQEIPSMQQHNGAPAGRRPERPERTGPGNASHGARRDRRGGWDVASLYVSAGRDAGVRPADLVGAITNELDLDSRAIGSIEIGPRFSLVEVPEEIADDIIAGLRGVTIKGQRVTIRRDRSLSAR